MSDQKTPIQFEEFTGGALDTNAFLIETPGGNILVDAPQGAAAHFADASIHTLLLTHGHFDHVADAAAIRARHNCAVGCHPDTIPMISDRNFFRNWGFAFEVEPVNADILLHEANNVPISGLLLTIYEVPGHCPGSLCFHLPSDHLLFGGDVLFRGGVGRTDLPGGDGPLLLNRIRSKLFPLPPETRVLPGHGPSTTIGVEKATNPWLQF